MSTEASKVVMRRYFEEIWNERKLELLDELIAADYVNHASPDPSLPSGAAGLKPVFASVLQTFPDIRFSIDDVVAEGEKVVTRWSMRATQRGEVMGMPGSGKQVTLSGISIDRIVDGKIVEHWRVQDDLGLAQQVGAVPGDLAT
jgi:steroid delta-isomerase-like uncharacterized protein